MPFEKGHEKTGGRQSGVQNKLTSTVKEVVLRVFNELQDEPENDLKTFAIKYPRDFYQIAAKLIPTEINAKLNKIQLEIVRTSPDQPDSDASGTDEITPEDTSQESASSL